MSSGRTGITAFGRRISETRRLVSGLAVVVLVFVVAVFFGALGYTQHRIDVEPLPVGVRVRSGHRRG